MKFFIIIDKEKEPQVTVRCAKVTQKIAQIEKLCAEEDEYDVLHGYDQDEILPIDFDKVDCFFTSENKVFALVGGKNYALKIRIKQVLETVDYRFIKINQG